MPLVEQELVTSVHVDGKTEYQGEKDRPAICHSQISSHSGIVSWFLLIVAFQYLVS
jgi:hypothetical protein